MPQHSAIILVLSTNLKVEPACAAATSAKYHSIALILMVTL